MSPKEKYFCSEANHKCKRGLKKKKKEKTAWIPNGSKTKKITGNKVQIKNSLVSDS